MTITKITNSNNKQFIVKMIFSGEQYGLNDCLTHTGNDPLVEFYDYINDQFISSYYASTLLQGTRGLALCGHVPEWAIDSLNMDYVRLWIKNNI